MLTVSRLRLFLLQDSRKIALVLVRFDHVANGIINANHSIMLPAVKLCVVGCVWPRSERQAESDFPVATFALPRNVAFSSTIKRGASTSPRNVQPAWSSRVAFPNYPHVRAKGC